ncbi:hypothetical protein J2S03_001188 [Alicyclobacillus cycloheptanicus]|uniref:Uncharacterized protein n=1 Tax=Alicyclobacillus cycloheptanicus TaxID=1457 RepID=A0ABT9XGE3_9BACL|nr:hypothetical protein [Alicyclobacillus cycloheptanicus]
MKLHCSPVFQQDASNPDLVIKLTLPCLCRLDTPLQEQRRDLKVQREKKRGAPIYRILHNNQDWTGSLLN